MKDIKKKNVLIVHNYYQVPGGEDTVVKNEKKLLEDNGHKVILYSRNNNELKNFSIFQKLLLPITTIFNLRSYRDIKCIIKKEEIDVVHIHNTLNIISPAVYYAAFALKIPMVQTIHNFRLLCPGATFYRDGHICEECVENGLACAVKYSCYRGNKLQTLACVVSTQIHRILGTYGKLNYICLTEFNKKKLLTLNKIRPQKVFVKPNFVETKGEIVPYEKRENQFVFVGRLDKLKGIDILLEAWKEMGDSAPKLVICGIGPMEEWCHRFISENGLENIEMKGFLPNDDVKEIMANSKAIILPTQWYEGFPMTILEAYSVGTPVIGSDIGNVGDLIILNKSGWKFKRNVVSTLISAINKNIDYTESTYKLYSELYTAEKNYKVLDSIYGEIE